MSGRVVITGCGVLHPLGDSPESLYSALCEGKRNDSLNFAVEKYLGENNFRPLDRTSQLATVAADLALKDSGFSAELLRTEEVGLALGTMFGSILTISEFHLRALRIGPNYASPIDFANTVINATAGHAAIWHNLRGVNSTIAGGSAAGLLAMGYASDLIKTGMNRAMLAGGAEELCDASLSAFAAFDENRNGFDLAEGAALLMLEDRDFAVARGANIQAQIAGYGSSFDSSLGISEAEFSEAIERAINLALNDSGMQASDIGVVFASANGSVIADGCEARALENLFGGINIPVRAIKSTTGELLGASGPLMAVCAIQTIRSDQSIRAPVALLNAISFDGNCSSLILKI